MWSADPDPARTLAIQAQIDRALADGDVMRAKHSGVPAYYFHCPWPSLYWVRRAVRIAGRWLYAPQQFTFHVGTERGRFVREIVIGPFHPTPDVYYGPPS